MKVCMLAYTFYDHDGRVRKYAESLFSRGDHVDVISLSMDEYIHEKIINGVNVYEIQKRTYNEKSKLSYLSRLIKFFFNSAMFLTRRHLKQNYDIIHIHSIPDFEVFAALVPKILGAKIILDIHDPVPDFFSSKFGYKKNHFYIKCLELIEKFSTKFADHVITVTEYWRYKIRVRASLSNNKISTIMNLPDTDLFNPQNYNHKEDNKNFVLLYPGTLNKHCGIDLVLEAIASLKTQIPSIRFDIYGKGSELNNLLHLAKKLKLHEHVFFNDLVPWQSIPQLMLDSDVGIALLSGDEYSQQALNVKLFEFLSMGIPVVATKTNSTKYYLDDNVVMFSMPNDTNDIARCIGELYRNSEKRIELKKRGLDYIKLHNWKLQMNNYLHIIDNLMKK